LVPDAASKIFNTNIIPDKLTFLILNQNDLRSEALQADLQQQIVFSIQCQNELFNKIVETRIMKGMCVTILSFLFYIYCGK
jgi:hypothetical protein